jgi:hypothetical protein
MRKIQYEVLFITYTFLGIVSSICELFGIPPLFPAPKRPGRAPTRRVGNFRQKYNFAEDGTNVYFRRNSGCSAEQKPPEFRSEPFRGRENNSEFRSVEQNRSTLSEFRSEPFRGRENNSESVPWNKKKQTLGILFRTIPRKRKQLGIPFRVEKNAAGY